MRKPHRQTGGIATACFWLLLIGAVGGAANAWIVPEVEANAKLAAEIDRLEHQAAALQADRIKNEALLQERQADPILALERDLRNKGFVARGETRISGARPPWERQETGAWDDANSTGAE